MNPPGRVSPRSLSALVERLLVDIRRHCVSKGFREGPGINNPVPHDCVSAFQMARIIVGSSACDRYVAVAPEGHMYGYFFEALGVQVHSVFVDYPPTHMSAGEDLSCIKGQRVLIIEDDVSSGRTLRLVADGLRCFEPESLSLFLGHTRGVQHPENVPPAIHPVLIAEEVLDSRCRDDHVRDFLAHFSHLLTE